MTERFKKAYDALVNAYFEGTLAKGICTACACGNIIYAALGKPMTKENIMEATTEAYNLWGYRRSYDFSTNLYFAKEGHEDIVNAAGYTAKEFAIIETAFERNTYINFNQEEGYSEQEVLEDQYRGLCAVVNVLIQLDEAQENPDELKKKFREHPKLQTA